LDLTLEQLRYVVVRMSPALSIFQRAVRPVPLDHINCGSIAAKHCCSVSPLLSLMMLLQSLNMETLEEIHCESTVLPASTCLDKKAKPLTLAAIVASLDKR
jgi:hypothetical protein